MTNTFVLTAKEMLDIDELPFLAHGGTALRCSTIDDCGCVSLHVEGSRESIRTVAEQIIALHGG